MYTNIGRMNVLVVLWLVLTMLLASCTAAPTEQVVVPSGQVQGVLVDDGEPVKGMPLVLGCLLEKDPFNFSPVDTVDTDDSGAFVFEDVMPGSYVLALEPKRGNYQFVLGDSNDLLAVDVSEGTGVYLSEVEVSKILKPGVIQITFGSVCK